MLLLPLYALEYLWRIPIWLIDRLCKDTPSRSGAANLLEVDRLVRVRPVHEEIAPARAKVGD
jgi:hypothetical protein